ncbi:hypothetical protein Emed_004279 [Eimeria media]
MPRAVSFGPSFSTDELVATQSTLSTDSPTQHFKGDVLSNITRRRRPPWFAAVGALLAAAAVVFLISYCRVRTTDVVGSKLTRRRLAGQGGDDDQQASEALLLCTELLEDLDEEESVSEGDSLRTSTPSEAAVGGAVVDIEGSRKRKHHEDLGEGHSSKQTRFSEESGESEMTSRVSLSAMESQSGSAFLPATVGTPLHPSIESVVSGIESEGLPSVADSENEEEESLELPEKMLDFYIFEALKGSEELPLASWLLDPELSMPPSPASEVSSQEDLERVFSQPGKFQKPFEAVEALQVKEQQQVAHASGDGSRSSSHHPQTISPSWTKPEQLSIKIPGLREEASTPDTGGEGSDNEQAGPSTSADVGEPRQNVPASSPSWEPPYEQHPFYRVPAVPKDMAQEALSPQGYPVIRSEGKLWGLLEGTQQLLVKPYLAPFEVQALVDQGQALLDHAKSHLTRLIGGAKPSDFASSLFKRLLVADQLYRVCAVVGESFKKDEWWEPLMTRMLVPPHSWMPRGVKRRGSIGDGDLVVRVLETLDTYREGRRPDAATVVGIKQAIFCSSSFSSTLWNSWRAADAEFWSSELQ